MFKKYFSNKRELTVEYLEITKKLSLMPLAKDNHTQYFGIHTFNWEKKLRYIKLHIFLYVPLKIVLKHE